MTRSNKPTTILTYFCILELGRRSSNTAATSINKMMLLTQSVKNCNPSPPAHVHSSFYRIINDKFPAATIIVTARKNIKHTVASAANTKITALPMIDRLLIIGPPPRG